MDCNLAFQSLNLPSEFVDVVVNGVYLAGVAAAFMLEGGQIHRDFLLLVIAAILHFFLNDAEVKALRKKVSAVLYR